MKNIILKKGREKSLLRQHPWIFSGAIENEDSNISNGEIVDVFTFNKTWIARGTFSAYSQIRVRVWSFDERKKIDSTFISEKIMLAHKMRKDLIGNDTNAYRMFFSESDGIPGLIVDKYDEIFVCTFLSSGAEKFKKEIVDKIKTIFSPKSIYERSDVDVRLKEGLKPEKGLLFGEEPDELIQIKENGVNFFVNIKSGHKTGMYIDQRESRLTVRNYAKEKEVLNCFSYTGGFSVNAILGGAAKVTNIDSSQDALDISGKNFELNNIDKTKYQNICADVFRMLRTFKDENKKFDMIILDPPKFADSKASIDKAARGYKDINMNAINILNKGGLLFTFSCSGLITAELFQKIVADAALDANRQLKFIGHMKQSFDHPASSNFPESFYLKGLIAYSD
jgi:23S rRNA (cytosine1962-C5)-methyltransferase